MVTQRVYVPILNDDVWEQGPSYFQGQVRYEKFKVLLENPVGAVLDDSLYLASVSIADMDIPDSGANSVTDVTLREDNFIIRERCTCC